MTLTHRAPKGVVRTSVALMGVLWFACAHAPTVAEPTPVPAPAPAAAPAEVIEFRYAWPDKVQSEVRSRSHHVRAGKTKNDEHVLKMDSSRTTAGRTVEWSGDAFAEFGLTSLAFNVKEDASFDRLRDVEAMMEALRQSMEKKAGKSGMNVDKMLPMLQSSIEHKSQEEWGVLVALWAGQHLTVGEPYETVSSEEVPGTDKPITLKRRVLLTGRVPCSASEAEARCVEVKFHSEPSPEELPAITEGILKQLLQAMPKGAPEIKIRKLTIRNDATIVTEPQTLLPHKIFRSRQVLVTIADPTGDKPSERLDESTDEYTYAK